jgi:hypothetical protein
LQLRERVISTSHFRRAMSKGSHPFGSFAKCRVVLFRSPPTAYGFFFERTIPELSRLAIMSKGSRLLWLLCEEWGAVDWPVCSQICPLQLSDTNEETA